MKVAISMGRIWLGGDGSLGGGAIIRVLSVEREGPRGRVRTTFSGGFLARIATSMTSTDSGTGHSQIAGRELPSDGSNVSGGGTRAEL